MHACAQADSGVHEINHFCQSLPLTLIKSMPLYRRQLRRRLWQRGVLSWTKCHSVHYLLQEAWGEKCDAAPVSKKGASVCEVDISLNPYQWHIFQAVTSQPRLFLSLHSLTRRRSGCAFLKVPRSNQNRCLGHATVTVRGLSKGDAFFTYLMWRSPGYSNIATCGEKKERNGKMRIQKFIKLKLAYFAALALALVPVEWLYNILDQLWLDNVCNWFNSTPFHIGNKLFWFTVLASLN